MTQRGRPRLEIDSEALATYYEAGHTLAQCAVRFGCCVATARNHYRYVRPAAPLRRRGTRPFAGREE